MYTAHENNGKTIHHMILVSFYEKFINRLYCIFLNAKSVYKQYCYCLIFKYYIVLKSVRIQVALYKKKLPYLFISIFSPYIMFICTLESNVIKNAVSTPLKTSLVSTSLMSYFSTKYLNVL